MKDKVLVPGAFNNQLFTALAMHFMARSKPLPPVIFDSLPPSHLLSQLQLLLPTEAVLDSLQSKQPRRQYLEKAVLAGSFFRAYYSSLLEQMTLGRFTELFLPRLEAALTAIETGVVDGKSIDEAFDSVSAQYGALLMANKDDFLPFVIQRLIQSRGVHSNDPRVQGASSPITDDFKRCWNERGVQNYIQAVKTFEFSVCLEDIGVLLEALSLQVSPTGPAEDDELDESTLYLATDESSQLIVTLNQSAFSKRFNREVAFFQFYTQSDKVYAPAEFQQGLLLPALTAPANKLAVLAQTIELFNESKTVESCYRPLFDKVVETFSSDLVLDVEKEVRVYLRESYFSQQSALADVNDDFCQDWCQAASGNDILRLQQRYMDDIASDNYQAFLKEYQRYYKGLMAYAVTSIDGVIKETLLKPQQEIIRDFMATLLGCDKQSEVQKLQWLALLDAVVASPPYDYAKRIMAAAQMAKRASFQDTEGGFLWFKKPSLKAMLMKVMDVLEKNIPLAEAISQAARNIPALRGIWNKHGEAVYHQSFASLPEALDKKQCLEQELSETKLSFQIESVPGTTLYQLVMRGVSYDELTSLMQSRIQDTSLSL